MGRRLLKSIFVKTTIVCLLGWLMQVTVAGQGARARRGAKQSSTQSYRWRNVVIVGGGFVTGIITHPGRRGLIYARTDVGGAYRRDSPAGEWIPLTDMIGMKDWHLTGIESLAVDPSHPNRVYLAAGIYTNPRVANGAILRSQNGGRTWLRTDMALKMGGNEAGRAGASGWPLTRTTVGFFTSARATTASGEARTEGGRGVV